MDANPQLEKVSETSRTPDKELFGSVESSADVPPGRARTIAVWLGLITCAIVVSQFGRPSRAREAEFMRGAAKVAAIGKVSAGASAAGDTGVVKGSAARLVDEKALEPAVYASRKYGVAWQYPRNFVLRKGANAGLDLDGHYAAATAFAGDDNGVALASVIIPARLYPRTDFVKASLTARVNKKVSEEACGTFRILDEGEEKAQEFPAAQVTVGSTEFATAEAVIDGDLEDSATTREKFFHVYENAACYEFAMNVTTGVGGQKASKHVDADEVFERLQEILTSVTIVPVRSGEAVSVPTVAVAPSAGVVRHK